MKNYRNGEGIPLGFGMLLAQNAEAMDRFSARPDEKKQSIIDGAARVSSKKEMREYVNQIINGAF